MIYRFLLLSLFILKYLEKIYGKLKKNISSKLLIRYNKKVFMEKAYLDKNSLSDESALNSVQREYIP